MFNIAIVSILQDLPGLRKEKRVLLMCLVITWTSVLYLCSNPIMSVDMMNRSMHADRPA
jgi:hypothetical protein